jgi:hypothetical protein
MLQDEPVQIRLDGSEFQLKFGIFQVPLVPWNDKVFEPLAVNNQGDILAARINAGKGTVYALGGFAGIQDAQQPEEGFAGFIEKVISLSGVRQELEVISENSIQWRSGSTSDTTGKYRLLFIVNPGKAQHVQVQWPQRTWSQIYELRSDTVYPIKQISSGIDGFDFTIEEGDFVIIRIS